MANLISTVSLIAVLLIITSNTSSAYRTTTITATVDETDPRGTKEQCREEVEKQDYTDCALYMMGWSARGSKQDVSEKNQQEQQILEQCCSEIKRVDKKCQCDAIEAVSQELLMRGIVEKEEYEGVRQRAGSISSSCGLREHCDIRSMLF
ncbi:2S seed storage albumin protein-like [Mercurialis annua]|uniref:2S seed storage albumin protein-like n=1 Tax=Mercurialis annua TaxID=3986 RepID=UPI00215FCE4C|nr:2S seed storage albumin protein-like [Mercurialis annua]